MKRLKAREARGWSHGAELTPTQCLWEGALEFDRRKGRAFMRAYHESRTVHLTSNPLAVPILQMWRLRQGKLASLRFHRRQGVVLRFTSRRLDPEPVAQATVPHSPTQGGAVAVTTGETTCPTPSHSDTT